MSKTITVIGDVHGRYNDYLRIVKTVPFSVQVGDFGFNYHSLNQVDPECHRILAGNHDNYDELGKFPHFLGDFGQVTLNSVTFFFVRGALSIDAKYRTIGVDYWAREELSFMEGLDCISAYEMAKPPIVISHDAPAFIADQLLSTRTTRSFTNSLLQEMWNLHRPDLWIFGHHHMNKTIEVKNTTFTCLNELQTTELSADGTLSNM